MKCQAAAFLMAFALAAVAAAAERSLFSFDPPTAGSGWQTVDDGVMGGRSVGRLKVTEAGTLAFSGNLSLENNGGFSSARLRGRPLGLAGDDLIVARIKGDGRAYRLMLFASDQPGGVSFQQPFQTQADTWLEISFPAAGFVASRRGRLLPGRELNLARVDGLGFLLSDKQPGPFQLEIDWIKVAEPIDRLTRVVCGGTYPHHLQGVCTDGKFLYWSFTTTLVKTTLAGRVLEKVEVANHHGDLCYHDGRLSVAVNLGTFNDPAGNADSWVYVYEAESLRPCGRHEVQEVIHGAGGIGFRGGRFFVVGGLPAGVTENYVYEYDENFSFLGRRTIASGHTLMGIQTAAFADGRWWFGCYGSPRELLVTDEQFRLEGRYEADCALGIDSLPGGRLLVAGGRCESNSGCSGWVETATPNPTTGFSRRSSDASPR